MADTADRPRALFPGHIDTILVPMIWWGRQAGMMRTALASWLGLKWLRGGDSMGSPKPLANASTKGPYEASRSTSSLAMNCMVDR